MYIPQNCPGDTPVSTCMQCMERSEKQQNSRLINGIRMRQVLTLREVE